MSKKNRRKADSIDDLCSLMIWEGGLKVQAMCSLGVCAYLCRVKHAYMHADLLTCMHVYVHAMIKFLSAFVLDSPGLGGTLEGLIRGPTLIVAKTPGIFCHR